MTPVSRKVLWVGLIMAFFTPPLVGIVYVLCYIFQKETRTAASLVFAWVVVWTGLSLLLFRFFVASGMIAPHVLQLVPGVNI